MKLQQLRENKGFKPSFVADKLGISYRHLNRIENGEGYLTNNRAKILAKLYSVPIKTIKECYERR